MSPPGNLWPASRSGMGRKRKQKGLWPAPPCPGVKPATAVCCEVMPGAACVFLQVETDLGRVGWQPQLQRARRENSTAKGCLCPSPTLPGLGVRAGGRGGAVVRWAPWPHLDPDLLALLGTVFCGEPQLNARGEAWPPRVSEPLCPGAVDLPRRVQKAPARNQLEPEPGIQPPGSPGPLLPWLQLHQASH